MSESNIQTTRIQTILEGYKLYWKSSFFITFKRFWECSHFLISNFHVQRQIQEPENCLWWTFLAKTQKSSMIHVFQGPKYTLALPFIETTHFVFKNGQGWIEYKGFLTFSRGIEIEHWCEKGSFANKKVIFWRLWENDYFQ